MTWWQQLWARFKAVPLGVWAAIGAALTMFGMFLRGRRLDAEIAQAKLQRDAARAEAHSVRHESRAVVHADRALVHHQRARQLAEQRALITRLSDAEKRRLRALSPTEITREYLKLVERKKRRNP